MSAQAFQAVATYCSLAVTYLRDNFALDRPLEPTDIKPRPVGHWGCTPGVVTTWTALLALADRPRRLIVGTGHAGPAWLGCALAEGATVRLPDEVATGIPGLPSVARAFGAVSGGLQTELSNGYPGLVWPTGELGHAAGIAQGYAHVRDDESVVCLLGDGEIEAGATLTAMLASDALRRPPVLVINCNVLRMGGLSELGARAARDRDAFITAFGYETHRCDVQDTGQVIEVLGAVLSTSSRSAILLEGPKGAGCPPLPDGTPIEGQLRAHKTVTPSTGFDQAGASWLHSWMSSHRPAWLPDAIRGEATALDQWLPASDRRLARPLPRRQPGNPRPMVRKAKSTTSSTVVAEFTAALDGLGETCLVTSPDELTSNRLGPLRQSDHVQVAEVLNEALCIDWSIGAVTGGSASWHTAYEAFSPLVASPLAQHLKYLDHLTRAAPPLPRSLGVLLTSLGWRNVASHRDQSIYSALLASHSERLRIIFPVARGAVTSTINMASSTDGLVVVLAGDKTVPLRDTWVDEGPLASPAIEGSASAADVLLVVCGDVVAREAEHAAAWLRVAPGTPRIDLLAVQDVTVLYRSAPEASDARAQLSVRASRARHVFIAAPYAGELVVQQLVRVLGASAQILGDGRHHGHAQPGLDELLMARTTWVDIAEAVLRTLCQTVDEPANGALASAASGLKERRDDIAALLQDGDIDDWHGS
jgi:xylulose-5-phosphate/fructose-6-phosphate phosphoketolase